MKLEPVVNTTWSVGDVEEVGAMSNDMLYRCNQVVEPGFPRPSLPPPGGGPGNIIYCLPPPE